MSNILRETQPSKLNEYPNQIPSSPPALSASLDALPQSPPSLKPKRPPPITPRSFKRFFTPRSSLNGSKTRGSGRLTRHALRDVLSPPSSSKRNGPAFPNTPSDNNTVTCQLQTSPRTPGRKRKLSFCASSPPLQSSPLRRIRAAPSIYTDPIDRTENLNSTIQTCNIILEEPAIENPIPTPIPLRRSNALQAANPILLRNLYPDRSSRVTHSYPPYETAYLDETANFYSRPEDIHRCWQDDHPKLPFCTAACHTNSLVAVGDEEGGIRLLDSSKDNANFAETRSTLQPHMNSIMDMEFSSDDRLLVTASGDQTSHIIDMTTQTALYCLSKHSSSIKRVQFQPGSNDNVVATCSRDGSVSIWDLRYKAFDRPSMQWRCSLASEGDETTRISSAKMKYAQVACSIYGAHSDRARSKGQTESHRDDISVTSISFLPPGREHLFVTSCESNACVRLWDMRTSYSLRRKMATPLAITQQPESHSKYRQFGITSLVFSGDGNRLYTLCRNATIYTYSAPHLILGNSNELALVNQPQRRFPAEEAKAGLGPIYGFRHPRLHVSTFFVKLALRRAANDNTELLAVGSSDNCAVLFPTNERYFNSSSRLQNAPQNRADPTTSRFGLRRTNSSTGLPARLEHDIPIYQHGTALVGGHQKEVSSVSWTHSGDLVTISDDLQARCWREGTDARDLRTCGDGEGKRWNCGWAEVNDSEYDQEEC